MNCLVVGAHAHPGAFFNYYHIPYGRDDQVIGLVDALGIDEACVFSFAGVNPDLRLGNDLIAASTSKHPERLHGLVTLNLNCPGELGPRAGEMQEATICRG